MASLGEFLFYSATQLESEELNVFLFHFVGTPFVKKYSNPIGKLIGI